MIFPPIQCTRRDCRKPVNRVGKKLNFIIMKKTLFTCFTGILLNWAITSVSYSQNLNSAANPEFSQDKIISSSIETDGVKISNPDVPGEISTKAIKDFARSYKNAPGVTWYKLKDGFAAYFTSDGIKTRVMYNKKGRFAGQIRDYFEDKLPLDVRHLVKSTYYDFSITLVNEIIYDGITAYLVHMEGKTYWKTVKIIDGEMEVAEEYLKR
jgi:hypothetical protein